MKRRDLIRRIAKAAAKQGVTWDVERDGGRHTVYTLDGLRIIVPRHNEINEITAQGILKDCEPKLGKGWWR